MTDMKVGELMALSGIVALIGLMLWFCWSEGKRRKREREEMEQAASERRIREARARGKGRSEYRAAAERARYPDRAPAELATLRVQSHPLTAEQRESLTAKGVSHIPGTATQTPAAAAARFTTAPVARNDDDTTLHMLQMQGLMDSVRARETAWAPTSEPTAPVQKLGGDTAWDEAPICRATDYPSAAPEPVSAPTYSPPAYEPPSYAPSPSYESPSPSPSYDSGSSSSYDSGSSSSSSSFD
jgi:FtsZ-interacting cell division protein ZipA